MDESLVPASYFAWSWDLGQAHSVIGVRRGLLVEMSAEFELLNPASPNNELPYFSCRAVCGKPIESLPNVVSFINNQITLVMWVPREPHLITHPPASPSSTQVCST
jgi:hypothetical protein